MARLKCAGASSPGFTAHLPALAGSALEPASLGSRGRSLRPTVRVRPPSGAQRPARASGQRGVGCHEASVSTGPPRRARGAVRGAGVSSRPPLLRPPKWTPPRGPLGGSPGTETRPRLGPPRTPSARRRELGARLPALAPRGREKSAPTRGMGRFGLGPRFPLAGLPSTGPGTASSNPLSSSFPSGAAALPGCIFARWVRVGRQQWSSVGPRVVLRCWRLGRWSQPPASSGIREHCLLFLAWHCGLETKAIPLNRPVTVLLLYSLAAANAHTHIPY